MRREERVTVQGLVKEQQPDGMSHGGGGGGGWDPPTPNPRPDPPRPQKQPWPGFPWLSPPHDHTFAPGGSGPHGESHVRGLCPCRPPPRGPGAGERGREGLGRPVDPSNGGEVSEWPCRRRGIPPPPTKVTAVGPNEIYERETGRATFGTQSFGSQTPPPPVLTQPRPRAFAVRCSGLRVHRGAVVRPDAAARLRLRDGGPGPPRAAVRERQSQQHRGAESDGLGVRLGAVVQGLFGC